MAFSSSLVDSAILYVYATPSLLFFLFHSKERERAKVSGNAGIFCNATFPIYADFVAREETS